MTENTLDAGACRRISTSWLSLAKTARDAGDESVALHHELKASEYLERAKRIEREEARKASTNEFLAVIGARVP